MKSIHRNFTLLAVDLLVFSTALPVLCHSQEPSLAPELTQAQISKLKADLKSADLGRKRDAAWQLGFVKDDSAVNDIALLFNETRYDQWEAAAWALGNIKGQDALTALLAQTSRPEHGRYIAHALGEIGDTSAVLPLIAMLKSADGESKGSAAIALGQIRDARAIEPLLPLLVDKTVFTATSYTPRWDSQRALFVTEMSLMGKAMRSAALDALVQINDRRALAPVEARLASEADEKFRDALSAAVDKLKTAPMPKPSTEPKPAKKHR